MPYFGICFGMQLAVVEVGAPSRRPAAADSTEFGPCQDPIVGELTEWGLGEARESRARGGDLGGTMRLGAYDCDLLEHSKAREIYGVARSPNATAIATRSTSPIATG